MTDTEQLKAWLRESRHTVFLGGAGVSTASGIPDFRSAHGLYMQKKSGISYEEMLSIDYYRAHTEGFYDFLRNVMLYPDAKPNPAHYALAKLERDGLLEVVITQNIDGLHQAAGSKNVLELHGSVHRNHCARCGKAYTLADILSSQGVPRCTCGGVIKPDVVLYEEPLDEATMNASLQAIRRADLLIVGGTSLNVYPAAGLLRFYRGSALVVINKTPTPADAAASLVIQDAIGEVLGG